MNPNWYESMLPSRERKMRGHFSTPSLLVEQILDACGYAPHQNLSRLRVLDPACGSGNFLAGAARRLIAYGTGAGLDEQAMVALVEQNVWGFDPDPVACFLAEMQLRTTLADLAAPSLSLHVHQADGLALCWNQCENVDLLVANPPYLAAKNNDLSGYRSVQGCGQSDSYLLFLDLALQVVRPNGWMGLILPDAVLARANASTARRRLLAGMTIHHLWHLAGVFTAYVGAVVIIAQKCPPNKVHQITWARAKWSRDGEAQSTIPSSLPQSLLHNQPRAELRYLLSTVQGTLTARLCNPPADDPPRFAPLSQFVSICRGEELGKESNLLQMEQPPDMQGWYPVLRGGVDVRSYETSVPCCWIAHKTVTKPLEHYLAPKLLVVKSTGYLQAALDLKGHVVLQTLYLLREHEDEGTSLYFLLALLNSRLLREYIYVLHTAYKWVQPQIDQHILASLPVPLIDSSEKEEIITRAKLLMCACDEAASVVQWKERVYEEQERAICALYESALSK